MIDPKSDIEVVCDLDHTLYRHPTITRVLFKISSFFHKLALKFVVIDKSVLKQIKGKKVVIMTGRDAVHDKKTITRNLERDGIHYEQLRMCPRFDLVLNWKIDFINKMKEKNQKLVWLDDDKPDGF